MIPRNPNHRPIRLTLAALATLTCIGGLQASTSADAATCPPDAATVPFVDEVAVLLHKPGDFGTVALTEIDTVTADGTRTPLGDTSACPDGEGAQLPLNGIGINPTDQFAYAIEDTLNYYPVGTGLIPAPNLYKIDATGRIEDTAITVNRPVGNAFPNLKGAFDYVAAYVGTFGDDGTYYTLGYNLTSFNPFTFAKGPIDWYVGAVDVASGNVTWTKADVSDPLCATIAEDFRAAYGTSAAANVGPIADWVYSAGAVVSINADHQTEISIDTTTGVATCTQIDNQLGDPSSIIVGMATLGADVYVVNAAGEFGVFDGSAITQTMSIGAINGDMGSNNRAPLQWDLQLSFANEDPADRTSTIQADVDVSSSIDLTLTNQGQLIVAGAVVRATKPDGTTVDVPIGGPIPAGGSTSVSIPVDAAAAGTYDWTFEIVAASDADGVDRTYYDVDSRAGSGYDPATSEDDAIAASVVVTAVEATSTTSPPTTAISTTTTVTPSTSSTSTTSTSSTSSTTSPSSTSSTSTTIDPVVAGPSTTTYPPPVTNPPVTGSRSGLLAALALGVIGLGLLLRSGARRTGSTTP